MSDDVRITVLLVHGHPVMIEGLKILVDSAGDLAVVATATTTDEAIELATERTPDVVLVDLELGDDDALELLPRIALASPRSKILGLTSSERPERHWAAALVGARGVITKDRPTDVLLGAIRRLHAGDLWFDRQLLGATGARTTDSTSSGLRVRVH